MSLKVYIDQTSRRTASKVFRNLGHFNNQTNRTSGLARLKEYKDGNYIVEFADGTEKTVSPNGVRGIGPGGIIYIADDFQLF